MAKKSIYKYVYWNVRTKKWIGRITQNKILFLGGDYNEEKDAAKSVDLLIIKNNINKPLQILTRKKNEKLK
jgi:hypothetical protein